MNYKKAADRRKKRFRWYDRVPALRRELESLRAMNARCRDHCVREILMLVKQSHPALMDQFVMQFPLNILRRRWYDKDPYLWLVFNGLRFADDPLLSVVSARLNALKKKSKKKSKPL
jgi:hypothetical protein